MYARNRRRPAHSGKSATNGSVYVCSIRVVLCTGSAISLRNLGDKSSGHVALLDFMLEWLSHFLEEPRRYVVGACSFVVLQARVAQLFPWGTSEICRRACSLLCFRLEWLSHFLEESRRYVVGACSFIVLQARVAQPFPWGTSEICRRVCSFVGLQARVAQPFPWGTSEICRRGL